MLLPLLNELRVARAVGRPRTRPDALRGDKAYSSRAIPAHLRSRGIKAVIAEPTTRKATGVGAAHAVAGPSGLMPPTTRTATSSNAAPAISSNGVASRRATTSTL